MKRRVVVKAPKSTQDMLKAFESELASVKDVENSTEIEGSEDAEMDEIMKEQRQVEIYGEDYNEKYEDVGGGFDSDDSIISLAEIKEYWNDNNIGDPILEEYSDFDSWFSDTRSNYLSEYHW